MMLRALTTVINRGIIGYSLFLQDELIARGRPDERRRR